MSVHIWAPEIHYLDNKWFIYYAGGDIDDIWAISLILSTNMFQIDMISISQGDVEYKTKLIAKILFELNIDNIAICKGISTNLDNAIRPQKDG